MLLNAPRLFKVLQLTHPSKEQRKGKQAQAQVMLRLGWSGWGLYLLRLAGRQGECSPLVTVTSLM
jgi:hypothetical protein